MDEKLSKLGYVVNELCVKAYQISHKLGERRRVEGCDPIIKSHVCGSHHMLHRMIFFKLCKKKKKKKCLNELRKYFIL